ncbi:MAG: 2-isopropylmalate synthase [Myxococcales bacterium]|nr:MAG: 2-isopropylmalate synthase [Myxococcales bacterium]
MSSDSPNYVKIFDTTLRDGEQSPGASMTSTEKLEIARTISRLGVDVIEAGFPAASPDDLAAVRAIAESVGTQRIEGRPSKAPPTICGLARAQSKDIDQAWEAVKAAMHPRIHTFIATSPIHREHKLRMSKEEVLKRVDEMVRYAASLCKDVEFSPEDAGRTEPEFMHEVLEVAIAAGASTLNIPDTVGYTLPSEFGVRIADIFTKVKGIENTTVSVHCHNDLGLATANSLAGINAGARQVEVAVNGIGERAGNTSLEEIVMALHTRKNAIGLETGIDTTQLTRASRLVSKTTGMVVQPNKAIVGANAFAHEAGIHQDGMLKHEETYEIMRPETVGATQTQLVLGKHSGRHAFAVRLQELGYSLEGEQLDKVFAEFKRLADKKKSVTDADLVALASIEFRPAQEFFSIDRLQVSSALEGLPTATIRLKGADGQVHTQASVGSGPIDALFKAIDDVVKAPSDLLEYSVHAVTEGIDALGEVSVRIRSTQAKKAKSPQHGRGQQIFYGHGADPDILVASAKAYLSALNRLLSHLEPNRIKNKTVKVAKASS